MTQDKKIVEFLNKQSEPIDFSVLAIEFAKDISDINAKNEFAEALRTKVRNMVSVGAIMLNENYKLYVNKPEPKKTVPAKTPKKKQEPKKIMNSSAATLGTK